MPRHTQAGDGARLDECVEEETALIACPDSSEFGVSLPRPFGGRFTMPIDQLYQAPGDPSPAAAGLWLGEYVTAQRCLADMGQAILDADRDWLDDNCELELARGFAPTWQFSMSDNCPYGEPLWGVKYFPGPQKVRIAYLPAYYRDCGNYYGVGTGHHGDSEMVMVQVVWNDATQHWEFDAMYSTAHYASNGDPARWTTRTEATFTGKPLSHPKIWISADKHANYDYECNGFVDECGDHPFMRGRLPVLEDRNIGSMHTPLLGCIASEWAFAGNGRGECFYTRDESFCGWQSRDEACVTQPNLGYLNPTTGSYRAKLVSLVYDEYTSGQWGPGPQPWGPGYPPEEPPCEYFCDGGGGDDPPGGEDPMLRAPSASPKSTKPQVVAPQGKKATPAPRAAGGKAISY